MLLHDNGALGGSVIRGRAFSSEVEAGSPPEHASKQELEYSPIYLDRRMLQTDAAPEAPLIQIADLLDHDALLACREVLASAPFRDGVLTAGAAASTVKRNQQARGDDPEVLALGRRCQSRKLPPCVGQELRRILKKPVDIGCAGQKGPAQDQPQTTLWIGAGIGQGQSRTPRTAKHPPGLQTQLQAQALHVGHQIRRGVVRQRLRRPTAAAATLVPQNSAGALGIEKLAVAWHAAAARPAMQKNHGHASRVAALFEIHCVPLLLRQKAVGKGRNGREQGVGRGG